jgi:capsular polysaccharide biosynthesis protein
MEPSAYAATIWRRSIWVVAAGIAGAAVAIALSLTSTATYAATSSLFVGVRQIDGPQGLAWGSLLGERVLPSIVRLGTSTAVLEPVVDELSLDGTAADLAGTLEVSLSEDTSVVEITARAASPEGATRVADAVAERLAAVATAAHADADGTSILQTEIVGDAEVPRFQASPTTRKNAVLGLGVGLLAGVVLAGLAELARPRVRDAADVAAVTALPVVAGLPHPARRGFSGPRRTAGIDRLAWLLGPSISSGGRLLLLGTTAGAAGPLARDLGYVAGARLRAVATTAAELRGVAPGPQDSLLLVVESGRTTRRSLATALAVAETAAVPVVGVVVDGVVPAGATWRTRLRAALRGNAPLPRHAVRREGLETPRSATRGAPRVTSSRVTAVAALLAVGLAYPLPGATSTAVVAGVLLLPVWIRAVPRFRGAVLLGGLAAVALVSGLLLAGWSAGVRDFAHRPALEMLFFVLSAVGTIGLVLWARTVMALPGIGVAYGLGLLVHGALNAAQSVNAYKFELSLPITIVVVALVGMRHGRLATVVALGILGLADILNDARSAFGFCVVAAGLVIWQARPVARPGGSNPWAGMLLLGTAAVGVYLAASELMVAGALGAEVQARTTTQIEQSGSLLLGGRPEWTATWALMQDRPWGYGLGVVPDSQDLTVARSGLEVTNIPTVEGYLENFMLTDRFELHSVAADLWAALGPAGLAFAALMGALLVGALGHLLARREASGLVCLLGLTAVWYLAFGTVWSNGLDVAFAVGLMLLPRQPARSRREIRGGALGTAAVHVTAPAAART